MTTTRPATSTAIAVAGPVFTGPEQLALAGFLAGYTGLTREAYALDLRRAWPSRRCAPVRLGIQAGLARHHAAL
jgi:hypothetical protein